MPFKRLKHALFSEPAVVPFVECPNCKELLEFGLTACLRCREEIDQSYAISSAVVVHHNTQAVSVANTISSGDAFIPIAVIVTLVLYFGEVLTSDHPRITFGVLVYPLIPLLSIIIWYFRFGRFQLGDEEYLASRKEMRRSFTFWLTFFIVQILLLAVQL